MAPPTACPDGQRGGERSMLYFDLSKPRIAFVLGINVENEQVARQTCGDPYVRVWPFRPPMSDLVCVGRRIAASVPRTRMFSVSAAFVSAGAPAVPLNLKQRQHAPPSRSIGEHRLDQ